MNVANLELARTTARAREIAVRLSVGASRPRLISQLLTESILLSVLGGALGIFFAIGATRAIATLMPDFYKPNEARITMNVYVLLFSLAVSLVTGILFGLTPALRCSRPDLAGTLKAGGRGAVGSASGQKVRGWLVAAEVGLSVILLAGASLAIRSFAQLTQIDPGFQPQKTLRWTFRFRLNAMQRSSAGMHSLAVCSKASVGCPGWKPPPLEMVACRLEDRVRLIRSMDNSRRKTAALSSALSARSIRERSEFHSSAEGH